jgi:hypothetical protein
MMIGSKSDDKVWDDDGSKVYMYGAHGGDNQHFYINPLSDGKFEIKIKSQPDGCMDYHHDNRLYMYSSCHGGDNQKFYFSGGTMDGPSDAAAIHVASLGKDKCLDYKGQGILYFYDCHGGDNQKFYFSGGTMTGQCKCNNPGVYNKAGSNGYTCTDSSKSGWCPSDMSCSSDASFPEDEVFGGCRISCGCTDSSSTQNEARRRYECSDGSSGHCPNGSGVHWANDFVDKYTRISKFIPPKFCRPGSLFDDKFDVEAGCCHEEQC